MWPTNSERYSLSARKQQIFLDHSKQSHRYKSHFSSTHIHRLTRRVMESLSLPHCSCLNCANMWRRHKPSLSREVMKWDRNHLHNIHVWFPLAPEVCGIPGFHKSNRSPTRKMACEKMVCCNPRQMCPYRNEIRHVQPELLCSLNSLGARGAEEYVECLDSHLPTPV